MNSMHDISRAPLTVLEVPQLSPLQRALILSGVPILDSDKVGEYKRQQLARKHRIETWTGLGILLLGVLIMAATGVFIPFSTVLWMLASVVSFGTGALLFLAGWCCVENCGDRTFYAWIRRPLQSYAADAYVPESVTADCRRIQACEPGRAFYEVDYLGVDPFISVSDGVDRYYFGCWGEQEFPATCFRLAGNAMLRAQSLWRSGCWVQVHYAEECGKWALFAEWSDAKVPMRPFGWPFDTSERKRQKR